MANLSHINLKPAPIIGRTPTEQEKQGMRQTLGLDSKADLGADGKILDSQFPDAVLIQLRAGTEAELDAAEPALEANEPVVETDTGRFRIGDTKYEPLGLDGKFPASVLPIDSDAYVIKDPEGEATVQTISGRLRLESDELIGYNPNLLTLAATYIEGEVNRGSTNTSLGWHGVYHSYYTQEGHELITVLGANEYAPRQLVFGGYLAGAKDFGGGLEVGDATTPIKLTAYYSGPEGSYDATITFPWTNGRVLLDTSDLDATKVSGVLAAANVPNLDASKIATGVLADERIPTTVARLDEDGKLLETQMPDVVVIQLRTGTESELDAAVPALADNEPAYVSDTGRFRLGNHDYEPLGLDGKLPASVIPIDATAYVTKEGTGVAGYTQEITSALKLLPTTYASYDDMLAAEVFSVAYRGTIDPDWGSGSGLDSRGTFTVSGTHIQLMADLLERGRPYATTRLNLAPYVGGSVLSAFSSNYTETHEFREDSTRLLLGDNTTALSIHTTRTAEYIPVDDILITFPRQSGEVLLDTSTLDASKVSGVLTAANIPNLNASKITAGTLGTARIPNLDASKTTTGVFADARIPATVARTDNVYTKAETYSQQEVDTLLDGKTDEGDSYTKAETDNLLDDKADLDSGTVPLAQVPSLPASRITSGELTDARIPPTIARTAAVTQLQLTNQPAGFVAFDGVSGTDNSFASAPHPPLVGGEISIAFKYRRDREHLSTQRPILATQRNYAIADGGWGIDHGGTGGNTMYFRICVGSTYVASIPDALADVAIGDWCVLGFNLSNTANPNNVEMECFLNGISIGSGTAEGTQTYKEYASNAPMSIAKSNALNTTQRAALGIANLMTANRLMTAQEHADFAASGGAVVPQTIYSADTTKSWSQDSFTVTTGYSGVRSTVTAGITVDGRSDVLESVGDGGSSSHQINMFNTSGMSALDYNSEVVVEVDYYIPSANTQSLGLRLYWRAGHTGISVREGSSLGTVKGEWATLRFRAVVPFTAVGDRFVIYHAIASGDATTGSTESIYIGRISVTRTGALSHVPFDDGNNYQARDMTGNSNHVNFTISGFTHAIKKSDWKYSYNRTSSGWLIGGDRPSLDSGAVIEYADVQCSAAGTVSLGYNSSNGAAHFTVAHPGGDQWVRVAMDSTSPNVTDRRLYLTAPSGATVNLNLTGYLR